MGYDLHRSVEILRNTPAVLKALTANLSPYWTDKNTGDGTWTVTDVVAHLILGEQTDWIPRTQLFLSDTADKRFVPFDMEIHLQMKFEKTLGQLLDEFEILRKQNLDQLLSLPLSENRLDLEAVHPEIPGKVTLRQHLSTWTVHDLNHIMQISRIMAKQWTEEVGPWRQFLSILN